jgi:tetratricopeptide (TPR) repeat protein
MNGSRGILAALGVALVVAAVHSGSLSGGFVYDDHRFIEHNAALGGMNPVEAFRDPATASSGEGIVHDIYRPLRTIVFSLEYAAFVGETADGDLNYRLPLWHGVSIVLHILNSLLVLRLLYALLRGALLPAIAGALLFGLHPMTSESVAWLSSQGDLLAMTFMLGALLLFEREGVDRTVGGLVCFVLACLAKESALMLPFLLPLRDLALPRDDASRPSPWARTTWIRFALLLGLTGLYFWARSAVLPGLDQVGHAHGSVWATVRAMLHGIGWYAEGLLAPFGFSFDTRIDVPERWSDPEVWVGFGLLGTLLVGSVLGLLRRRYLLTLACLGALVALGPVSNVLVPLKTFVADRFFYPALFCAAVGLGAALRSLRDTPRAAALTICAGLLAVFAWSTVSRNAAWASDATLWHAVREDRPWNANAYQGIAYEAARAKRVHEAENAYATYLEANPFDGKSIYTMGNLFGEMAEGLVLMGRSAPGEEVTTPIRRKQTRVAQIKLYQRAFEIWNRPGGLALGRGSPALVVDMLDHWIDAGTELGDLRTARFANDRAIEWEAEGPIDVADPAAVASRASWMRRRIRTEFAIRVVRADADRKTPAGMRAFVAEERAIILRADGFDPNKSNAALRSDFLRRLAALEQEAAAKGLMPDEQLFSEQVALLLGQGLGEEQIQKALRVMRRGLRVLGPAAWLLKEQHDELERRSRAAHGR